MQARDESRVKQVILFPFQSPASNKQILFSIWHHSFHGYLFIVLDFYWSHSKLSHAHFENQETRFINCQRTVDFLPSNLQCSTCRIKNKTKFTGQSIRFIHVYTYNLIELACIYTCGREIRVISLLGSGNNPFHSRWVEV